MVNRVGAVADMPLLPCQDFGEAPHFLKGIVQRHRRDTDDVRLAKIADDALGLQALQEFARPVMHQHRQLTAALSRVARRQHFDSPGGRRSSRYCK